jgi:hypothetical protein
MFGVLLLLRKHKTATSTMLTHAPRTLHAERKAKKTRSLTSQKEREEEERGGAKVNKNHRDKEMNE